ncbi:MAG TPA: hypothetical protein VN903_14155 [Polyangia bacterium]|jgi:hypothetical protein|nr:hypothetical protein [Polyangia bacterium]
MNKRTISFWAIVGVAGVLLLYGKADAGSKASQTVNIYGNGLRAMADLGAVRNSANTKEYFGCKVTADAGVTTHTISVSCSVQNSAGVQFDCSSTDANIINVALSIKGDSFVNLNRDATNNSKCTHIAVENSSDRQPKAP